MSTALAIVASVVRAFAVLLSRKASVDAALTALAKRAARKGLPVLTWTWGKPCTEIEYLSHEGAEYLPGARLHSCASNGGVTYAVPVTRISLEIEGETPKYKGWTFVAVLQHLDGENIVRALPGETVPETYRNRGPVCDHCRTNRQRGDTYLVKDCSGYMQVGSTCIRDFLGSDEAGKVAAMAEIFAQARALASEDGEGFGHASNDRTLAEYLPIVAWAVRTPGQGWTSRTKAREEGGSATADRAWTYLTDGREARKAGVEVTDEDRATAEAAEAWADSLTDATIAAETGDYLHNLRAVARTGLVQSRTAGLAASMVTAYQRAMGRERAKSDRAARPSLDAHLGTIGEKVTFGLPAKTTKTGKPAKGAPTVLRAEPVVLDFVHGFDTAYGYTTILKFRTADGAVLVWFASSTSIGRADVGKAYALTGTVKKHDDYKGSKQTTLTRCSATEATAPIAPAIAAPPVPVLPADDDYACSFVPPVD
jgi:hypothetical protein